MMFMWCLLMAWKTWKKSQTFHFGFLFFFICIICLCYLLSVLFIMDWYLPPWFYPVSFPCDFTCNKNVLFQFHYLFFYYFDLIWLGLSCDVSIFRSLFTSVATAVQYSKPPNIYSHRVLRLYKAITRRSCCPKSRNATKILPQVSRGIFIPYTSLYPQNVKCKKFKILKVCTFCFRSL